MRGMPVPATVLQDHLAYTEWASRRLVDAAARLTHEELTRDFHTADRSILGTLVHVFAADRVWLDRVSNVPRAAFTTEADYHMSVLQNDWPALLERWQRWAAGLTDESAKTVLNYSDMKGNPWSQSLWRIVLHVVNHGTHHRGQAAGFIRMLGYAPPPLDLIAYYREQRDAS
jgi:uncharacterized damage-inducible protein DinB